ncbi:MAG: hypothetical protein HFJ65_05945 [Eggerthellaceae bacterium]|nr:hypothetical protein [Eggerthellaceae bacterium]
MRIAIHTDRGISKAIAVALSVLLACASPAFAFAATEDIDAEVTGAQQAVEATAEEYNTATERVDEINAQIEENEAQISGFDEEITEYRKICSSDIVGLYKLHRNESGILSVILGSQDFATFLTLFDYFNRVQADAQANISRLSGLLQEREDAREQLDAAKADAESEQEQARQAAIRATYQREQAQKAAAEKAAREAQEAEAAKAAQPEQEEVAKEAASNTNSVGDADWSQDKSAFVRNWAGRLDAYLAGSPLAGQGSTFASAAWDAGIDPRFSAAISEVESSRGAACFRPHNAWGWGSSSWGSWEEAINAHAFGLARGYGYTVSVEGAKKYAANWEHWYDRVSEEMAKI